jgi:23S rRNA pseudouridine1911/1915/1917 synthase
MPYKLIKYNSVLNKKVQFFMIQDLKISVKKTQKLLAKGRVFDTSMNPFQNGQIIKSSEIFISQFIPNTRNLKPIYENDFFAVFNKPNGVLCHPNSRDTQYSLLDEVLFLYTEDASLVHRLDRDTSGLILVSKDKKSDLILKLLFENRDIVKKYQVVVKGKIEKDIIIDEPISKSSGSIGIKMSVNKNGKNSITKIEPIKYDQNLNQTTLIATPLTGRQHQIRVHLDYIGHSIVGDTLYGIDEKLAIQYLDKKLIPNQRLMLHACYLEFNFNEQNYQFELFEF